MHSEVKRDSPSGRAFFRSPLFIRIAHFFVISLEVMSNNMQI